MARKARSRTAKGRLLKRVKVRKGVESDFTGLWMNPFDGPRSLDPVVSNEWSLQPMAGPVTISHAHLAELTQCLIDANALLDDLCRGQHVHPANALLDDLCRGQHVHPDLYASDRKRVVENVRLRYFTEIPINRPLWPQRNAST